MKIRSRRRLYIVTNIDLLICIYTYVRTDKFLLTRNTVESVIIFTLFNIIYCIYILYYGMYLNYDNLYVFIYIYY